MRCQEQKIKDTRIWFYSDTPGREEKESWLCLLSPPHLGLLVMQSRITNVLWGTVVFPVLFFSATVLSLVQSLDCSINTSGKPDVALDKGIK